MKQLPLRYISRFTLEALTPVRVGAASAGLNNDSPVEKDVNGLPYIPGTSLCGVLRHALMEGDMEEKEQTVWRHLFGFQEREEGMGSRLRISSAYLLGEEVLEGLVSSETMESAFCQRMRKLPCRDHVRLTHWGASDEKNHGKFDEEVIYKGSRFVFDMELKGEEEDFLYWTRLLDMMQNPGFRLGGATRKGFGQIRIVNCLERILDLRKQEDLTQYLDYSSSLNVSFNGKHREGKRAGGEEWVSYVLELVPEDFFLFSVDGDEADRMSVKESVVEWVDGKPVFSEEQLLIPGSSVKGALAHRLAYHYNRQMGIYADLMEEEDLQMNVGENNKAVQALMGYARNDGEGKRGGVLFSDLYRPLESHHFKVLNHVKIDSFIGGAQEGALFDEEVVCLKENQKAFRMELLVEAPALVDEGVCQAWEATLRDLSTGLLPLGGGSMRGHGCFFGEIFKNGEKL